jgi:hypothetical protein
MINSLGEEK